MAFWLVHTSQVDRQHFYLITMQPAIAPIQVANLKSKWHKNIMGPLYL